MLTLSRTREIWKTAALPVLDLIALLIGAALAYTIRYQWFEENFEGVKKIYGQQYLTFALGGSLLIVIIYSVLGLYQIFNKQSLWQRFINLNLGVWLVLLGTITFLFFNEYNRDTFPQGIQISRFVLGTIGFFAVGSVLVGRLSFWLLEQFVYYKRIGLGQIVVVGEREDSMVVDIFKRRDIGRIHSYGRLDPNNLALINDLITSYTISEIYIFSVNSQLELELASMAERYKVSFIFSPSGFHHFESYGIRPYQMQNRYFFELQYSALDGWQVIAKRIFDIVTSSLFLIVFSWLYIIIAAVIKLNSPGAVFYLSERVGPDGKVFKLYKFRRFFKQYCTSETNPESKEALEFEQNLIDSQGKNADRGALYKIKNDPRMTKVGAFLEKTSLDEIPQFINVLIGNLSLVGPRPHQPREVRKYAGEQFKVLNAKPGITGLAQIQGRSDLHFDQEAEIDIEYTKKWSFWLDIWILIKTPFVLIFKKHKS